MVGPQAEGCGLTEGYLRRFLFMAMKRRKYEKVSETIRDGEVVARSNAL